MHTKYLNPSITTSSPFKMSFVRLHLLLYLKLFSILPLFPRRGRLITLFQLNLLSSGLYLYGPIIHNHRRSCCNYTRYPSSCFLRPTSLGSWTVSHYHRHSSTSRSILLISLNLPAYPRTLKVRINAHFIPHNIIQKNNHNNL